MRRWPLESLRLRPQDRLSSFNPHCEALEARILPSNLPWQAARQIVAWNTVPTFGALRW
jgi:hypothetical protein